MVSAVVLRGVTVSRSIPVLLVPIMSMIATAWLDDVTTVLVDPDDAWLVP